MSNPALWLQELSLWGNVLSGVFALATFGVALWAIRRTLPAELEKFRHTKKAERRAEVAEAVWGAAFRLILSLRSITDPGRVVSTKRVAEEEKGRPQKAGDEYWASKASERERVAEASNVLLETWALAELHLEEPILRSLEKLWRVRAEINSHDLLFVMDLNQPGSVPSANKRLFEEGPAKLGACEKDLKRLLGPIARHDLEHSRVPTPPEPQIQAAAEPQIQAVPDSVASGHVREPSMQR